MRDNAMEKYCNGCIYWDSEFVPCPITKVKRHAYQTACVCYITKEEFEKKFKMTFGKKDENLKPCPFCGGEAEIDNFAGVECVVCKNCRVIMLAESNKEAMVQAWNRRE